MVSAVYPNGIVPWTPRVDKVNTVYALDPNTLAAEIQAIEGAVGLNPHIEAAPPVGKKVTYASTSARIHDVQMGNQMPVASVVNNSFQVSYPGGGTIGAQIEAALGFGAPSIRNSYNNLYDPFGYYNGNDLTIPAGGTGWYSVSAYQQFSWAESGWVEMQILIGFSVVTADHWSWDFPENKVLGSWNQGTKILSAHWEGIIPAGTRITVNSTNASNQAVATVKNAYLKIRYDRAVPANAQG